MELEEQSGAEQEGEGRGAVLIIASSESDSDLFHATRFLASDPLIYVELEGERILLASDLEIGRARRQARVDRVEALSPLEEEIRSRGVQPDLTGVLDLFLKGRDVKRLVVPESFPLGRARSLERLGYRVVCRRDPFFESRAVKSAEEVACIRRVQEAAQEAVDLVIRLLRRSEIRGGLLHLGGRILTAEKLRAEAQKSLLENGCFAPEVIIAPGDQGCDPHLRGTGPIPAHQTLVIDIFPRHIESRFWGDITRTVVRGEVSGRVRDIHEAVLEAQRLAIGLLRPGEDAREIHAAVVECFASRGHPPAAEHDGRKIGFIHSTGHGVGLDIHEHPSVGKVRSILSAGNVLTIEPGLYYPGVGAVRIEDLLLVTPDGSLNLTDYPKEIAI